MRYVKVNDERIPAEVLVTHTNSAIGMVMTHHYCFRVSYNKTYLVCYKVDGEDLPKKSRFFMSFVLGNKHTPMELKQFKRLKAFL